MRASTRSLLVAVALVGTSLFVSASAATDRAADRGYAGGYFFQSETGIKGTVVARSGESKTRVYTSLHQVAANTPYQVVGVSEPCSLDDAADHVLWKTSVRTPSGDDLVVSTLTRNTPTTLPLALKSVRIFSRSAKGDPVQVGCGEPLRRCASPYCGGSWIRSTEGIGGLVVASTGKSTARVYTSLHGLDANATYQIAGSPKPCSVVDAEDDLIWTTKLETASADDVFTSSLTMFNTKGDPVARVRSIRVYEENPAGGRSAAGCGKPTNP
jgi:hypothetical protein